MWFVFCCSCIVIQDKVSMMYIGDTKQVNGHKIVIVKWINGNQSEVRI